MMWTYGMGWGGWLLMSLVTAAFWALVVVGIVALFRGGRSSTPPARRLGDDEAQHVLDERFARGDIDAEEYRRRQQVLRSAH